MKEILEKLIEDRGDQNIEWAICFEPFQHLKVIPFKENHNERYKMDLREPSEITFVCNHSFHTVWAFDLFRFEGEIQCPTCRANLTQEDQDRTTQKNRMLNFGPRDANNIQVENNNLYENIPIV